MPRKRTPTRRSARTTLTRRFALTSFVGLLVVGLALVAVTSHVLDRRALAEGVSTATAITRWSQGTVPGEAYTTGVLQGPTGAALRTQLVDLDLRVVGLRLWAGDRNLLFDTSPEDRPLDAARFVAAMGPDGGASASAVVTSIATVDDEAVNGVHRRPVLDVYVPVRHRGEVVGVAEVLLDHTDAQAAQDQAIRTIALVTGVGLLGLWLVLARSVQSASADLQRTARENARLALLDPLTGLPNRRMLMDHLRRAVGRAKRSDGRVAMLLLDLDGFKDVNDSLGHDRGDELLEIVAGRLRATIRSPELVARLGGDEFAVLLPRVAGPEEAYTVATRVRALFSEPFVLAGGMQVHVGTSVGVAMLPDQAGDTRDLMRKADVAMYTAKQQRLGVAVYDAAADRSSPARLVLQAELHRALEHPGELVIHYQPTVDLATGRVIGLEALMRWRHPRRGAVEPAVFIPLAEQSGLIHELTAFALGDVVARLATWPEPTRLPVAVNLSGMSVTTPDVVTTITTLLAEHDVAARWLQVEIAETAVVADPARVVPVLRGLVDAGVRVAIDDFGIGSTSFVHLRDLPVDALKIDRLFVADLADESRPRARTVIRAMVELAHSFGMQVVAEGVEDAATAATLAELEVDQAQGYWYSPAVAADALELVDPVAG